MEEKLSKKKIRSRLKIMHAAKCLFEQKGLENVTFTMIAKNAGVCRTTVFNHFSNTGELMQAIYSQEIADIKEMCRNCNKTGSEMIYVVFERLIEDTSYYPVLTFKLLNNAIISDSEDNPIKYLENIIIDNLSEGNKIETAEMIMGAYYGLINHYHINRLNFERIKMTDEFFQILKRILGGENNE